jgi:ricin-type beta-trefoil lectin protein
MWTAAYAAELAGAQSGLCLTDPASSTKNGTQVTLGRCEEGTSVEWTLPAGEVMSGVPGKCVTDAGGASANGTEIVLEPCTDSSAQRWTFDPDGTLRIFGKCLSTPVMGTGALAVLEPCGNSAWQQWGFGHMSTLGSFIDGFKDGDSYYDLEAPAAANGTQLTLGDDVGPGGHWFLW